MPDAVPEGVDATNVAAAAHASPVGDVFGAARPEGPDPLVELQRAEQGIVEEPAPEPEPEVEYEVVDEDLDDDYELLDDEEVAELEELRQERFEEAMEELAEEDPVQALNVLADLHAQRHEQLLRGEMQSAMERQIAPVLQQHQQETAAATLEALRGDVGDEAFDRHREQLAAAVQADPERFWNPKTRAPDVDRLREVLFAAEYVHQQNFDWAAYEKEQLAPGPRDTFGGNRERQAVPVTRAQFDALQNENTRRVKRGAPPLPGFPGVKRTAHVEGGSGPQPQPLSRHVDPEIEAMNAIAHGRPRDSFGRRY